MSLFSQFASLFTAIVQPGRSAYTTVIYPIQGKPVVVHDGLGICHESKCYQHSDLLLGEGMETISSFDDYLGDHAAWVEPFTQIQAANLLSSCPTSCYEFMDASQVNPVNGLPMMDSCFDVMGNPYGMDTAGDILSFDDGMRGTGGGSSSFGFD